MEGKASLPAEASTSARPDPTAEDDDQRALRGRPTDEDVPIAVERRQAAQFHHHSRDGAQAAAKAVDDALEGGAAEGVPRMPREELHHGDDGGREGVAEQGPIREGGTDRVQEARDVVARDGAERTDDDREGEIGTVRRRTKDEEEEGSEPTEGADQDGQEVEESLLRAGCLAWVAGDHRRRDGEVHPDLKSPLDGRERDQQDRHAGQELHKGVRHSVWVVRLGRVTQTWLTPVKRLVPAGSLRLA